MASCDIPVQVWVLFSMAPNLRGLFWTSHWSPRSPYPMSLYLHPTNCTLSHNTLSAFNYCLEVSGLRVAHSFWSLCVHVCAVCVCTWLSRLKCAECPLYDGRSIEGSAEFHGAFSPCSSRIAHPWPATTSAPRTHFRRANGSQGATGKHRECVGAVIASV